MKATEPTMMERSRRIYASAAVLVVGAGLLWRAGVLPLSTFLTKYGGDAFWALLVFVAFGFVFARISTTCLVFISIGFAWAIEFSQLYHAHWIDALRSTPLGHLILGSTFNSPDLLAYVIGIAPGAVVECLFLNSKIRNLHSGHVTECSLSHRETIQTKKGKGIS